MESTCETLVALRATSVVDTLEANSGGSIAVPDSIQIHVVVALTRQARLHGPKLPVGVSEVSIPTNAKKKLLKSAEIKILLGSSFNFQGF